MLGKVVTLIANLICVCSDKHTMAAHRSLKRPGVSAKWPFANLIGQAASWGEAPPKAKMETRSPAHSPTCFGRGSANQGIL
ncbi:hypothetical protein ES702_00513 [subsurface metagenome]